MGRNDLGDATSSSLQVNSSSNLICFVCYDVACRNLEYELHFIQWSWNATYQNFQSLWRACRCSRQRSDVQWSLCRNYSHVPPGGGPPPHSHVHEDETFYNLEGDFEFLHEGEWHPLGVGETVFGPRGSIHTFRNAGKTTGRILVFITPAGFEDYLEEISFYSPATDMPKILEISKRFGVTFYPDPSVCG